MKTGNLYLLPSPLGPAALHTLPEATLATILPIRHFVLETGKVGRAFLKEAGLPLQECTYYELNKRTENQDLAEMLEPTVRGEHVCLLSDAGAPGVADPGARLVLRAHQQGVRVVPLVGPSAILLSIMAAGLNGQAFTFNGYLSPKRNQLAQDLKRLEKESRKNKSTQLWIEVPYRNQATVETALASLSPETLFSVACDLTLETEYIFTGRVKDWDKGVGAELQKRPAMFLLLG
ncbi:SAM-dependent methyltransferase [Neolewinella antarctica]|uniref:16S rRNA (Cytidine1402-2'-O)-methyltransferase n=1 Tax=Neolewinella antarctica TaxID=442734 RepID=A0ABX0XFF6_9BACT|nr:SAM-dependent methyltransferase [Neolewinella antarctica]NJC27937.1 16S rRNA (cytidine1402-2'-O)-methyltransferase [Neolewinella antarctica]